MRELKNINYVLFFEPLYFCNYLRDKIESEIIGKINLDPKNKCDIYIWRYGKEGNIKTTTCCKSCTKLANKYNYQNRIFTFDGNNIINAVVDNPGVSLGNMLRNL